MPHHAPSTRQRLWSTPVLLLSLLGILAGVLVGAAPAHADSPDQTVSVTPNKIVAKVTAGPDTVPITLTNNKPTAVDVTLTASGLTQSPSGAPAFSTPADAAPQIGSPKFTLAPGQSRAVPVTFPVSSSTAGLYEAILATVTDPPAAGSSSASTIGVAARLAVLVELTGPAPARDSAAISDISATGSTASGHVTFTALVHNTGDTVISPVGTATIAQGGATLATVPLGQNRVVPGSAVTYSGAWNSPSALGGHVSVHIHLDDPTADATGTITFRSGAAPKTAATISSLRASANATSAKITAQISNTGNTAIPAALSTAVFTGDGYTVLSTSQPQHIGAGHDVSVSQTVQLSPGVHELTVKVLDGSTVLDQRQVTVTVKASHTAALLLAAIALIMLLGLAFWLVRRRTGRKRR